MLEKRLSQALNRLQKARNRFDTRAWVVARRERTRHLIELGGLVQKAGLVEISDDDRAMLYGAFLDLAMRMKGEEGTHLRMIYRRRGSRAFSAEVEARQLRKAGWDPPESDPRHGEF